MEPKYPNRYRLEAGRRRIVQLLAFALALTGCGGYVPMSTGGFHARPYNDYNYGQPAGDPINSLPVDLALRDTPAVISRRG